MNPGLKSVTEFDIFSALETTVPAGLSMTGRDCLGILPRLVARARIVVAFPVDPLLKAGTREIRAPSTLRPGGEPLLSERGILGNIGI